MAEKKSRRLLVVPHMGTRTMATASSIAGTLPAVESSIFRSKAGLGAESADIKQGRLFDHFRQVASAERPDKSDSFLFEPDKLRCDLLGHGPGVAILGSIIVTDAVLLVSFRRPCLAVGKVPGDKKRYFLCPARWQLYFNGERHHRRILSSGFAFL